MFLGFFEEVNEHKAAWQSRDWEEVSRLASEFGGLEKAKLFDIVEQITYSKKPITIEQLSIYNKWFINNALSQNPDCLFYVNQMNMMGSKLSDLEHYNYYLHAIRKNKRYAKWAKVSYETELELYKRLLSKKYKINLRDAEVYYNILKNKNMLEQIGLKHLVTNDVIKGLANKTDKKLLDKLIDNLK